MKRAFLIGLIITCFGVSAFAQLNFPRASQRSSVSQVVGDANLTIVYNRPNVNDREVWGKLVPYGEVWRTGANEATVIELDRDATINGQPLKKGKYSLHTIPTAGDWTLIFNKVWNQWGSFNYNEKEDALRINVKPTQGGFTETMAILVEDVTDSKANVVIAWDKLRVPFTVDFGDVNKRVVESVRRELVTDPIQAANWVINSQLSAHYDEAMGWIDQSIRLSENYGNLTARARLLAEMGKRAEAIKAAEKAIEFGKKSTPPANTTFLEGLLAQWKAQE